MEALTRHGCAQKRTIPSAPEPQPLPPRAQRQLEAIDELMADYQVEEGALQRAFARAAVERAAFVEDATSTLRHVIKPLFETVAARLAQDGGGGLVVDTPPAGRRGLRLTLWMSLAGRIAGAPRQDRNPYIQLDLDAEGRQVRVWEGDIWDGLGTSRPGSPLSRSDLTEAVVLGRTVDVLRRATGHTRRLRREFALVGHRP